MGTGHRLFFSAISLKYAESMFGELKHIYYLVEKHVE